VKRGIVPRHRRKEGIMPIIQTVVPAARTAAAFFVKQPVFTGLHVMGAVGGLTLGAYLQQRRYKRIIANQNAEAIQLQRDVAFLERQLQLYGMETPAEAPAAA
jgi:hypothetical protein